MALAKFKEDINERYLDDIEALENSRPRRDPSSEWSRLGKVESDAVALRGADGLWWDDQMVFQVGLKNECDKVAARPSIPSNAAWQSVGNAPRPKITQKNERLAIEAMSAVSGDLVVTCGNYSKTYRISFVQKALPESVPDFARELAALTAHPPSWTQTTFDKFRDGTEQVLASYKLPADFCDGVREYHLGLFHEQVREGRFGDRLDRAYTQLYPFVPYSRLAALICGYYLYRVNEFDHPLVEKGLRRLGSVADFFAGRASIGDEGKSKRLSRSADLVVSAVDEAIIEAIEFLQKGRLLDAESAANRASTARCVGDTHGLERVHFLKAQIFGKLDRDREAARESAMLANSGVRSFRALTEGAKV